MAPLVCRASTVKVVAQQRAETPVAVPRRAALSAVLAPLAAAMLAPMAQAANPKNLSRQQVLAMQRAERKEALKERADKIKKGEAKPKF
ncbi:hypothetical protein HYH03_003906 [Edaphochlamys debaryana]|uniref:Uncharacterized protein n=1 Tax=Edaphochlamys debaryana TaxID=47281 RepID=A0A836C3T2_9CHLO|nr:hypothetical protein HYH03_003906 [Edaphochlamys debaryana]|eukprot:KAG2498148.1 hypothetical protein HYH03_003906 [Edaphochlamys debaryana]